MEGEPSRAIRVAKAVAPPLTNKPVADREGQFLAGWHRHMHLGAALGPVVASAQTYLEKQQCRTFNSEGDMVPGFPTVLRSGLGGVRKRTIEAAALLEPIALIASPSISPAT